MATKHSDQEAEKTYTYEEYCEEFCVNSDETDMAVEDPAEFGAQLAKDALARIEHNTRHAKDDT
ncbi:MAG TPA: hypothetical protein VJM12_09195 [Pyrinomonadaceae bacterium]|nr:hypothetical protein [Pyrinomonadaceae bacterium]